MPPKKSQTKHQKLTCNAGDILRQIKKYKLTNLSKKYDIESTVYCGGMDDCEIELSVEPCEIDGTMYMRDVKVTDIVYDDKTIIGSYNFDTKTWNAKYLPVPQ